MGEWAELGMIIRIYWSLMLGNVVEWYEFTAYGYQAKYMKANFFSGSSVGVWLGFACTFLARPLGAFVLGWIGDRWGRTVSVNISIIGMLVGTVGQGCLPSQNCGIPWLANLGLIVLVILRFIQGLCAAGEIGTIRSFFQRHLPHRGFLEVHHQSGHLPGLHHGHGWVSLREVHGLHLGGWSR